MNLFDAGEGRLQEILIAGFGNRPAALENTVL
jgi:hypothetical protein